MRKIGDYASNLLGDYGYDDAMRDLGRVDQAADEQDWKYGPCGVPPKLLSYVVRDLTAYIGRLVVTENRDMSDGLLAAERERMRLQAMIHTLSKQHPEAAEMLFRERKLNETLLEMRAERDALRKVAEAAMEGDDGCCSCCIYQSTPHDKEPCVSCGLRLALAEWETTR